MTEEESAVRAIRRHCLRCSGGSREEVDRCPVTDCDLYRWRTGKGKPRQEKDDPQITLEQWNFLRRHGA